MFFLWPPYKSADCRQIFPHTRTHFELIHFCTITPSYNVGTAFLSTAEFPRRARRELGPAVFQVMHLITFDALKFKFCYNPKLKVESTSTCFTIIHPSSIVRIPVAFIHPSSIIGIPISIIHPSSIILTARVGKFPSRFCVSPNSHTTIFCNTKSEPRSSPMRPRIRTTATNTKATFWTALPTQATSRFCGCRHMRRFGFTSFIFDILEI